MDHPPISAYQETLGLSYFPRMLNKIRLNATNTLREDFISNLGTALDARCVNFLRVTYEALCERTLQGGSDEEILNWCHQEGRALSEGDCFVWNEFIRKVGWNDGVSEILTRRKLESGLEDQDQIQTMLEYFEYDEGRKKP
jgi:Domain of unknown function (DUF5069)